MPMVFRRYRLLYSCFSVFTVDLPMNPEIIDLIIHLVWPNGHGRY
jgi:hypothetical protein